MNERDFWCRAFLAAMQAGHASDSRNSLTHEALALYGEQAADAAIDVARRRGMVTGDRQGSALDAAAIRWLNALRANDVAASEAAERDLLRSAEALDRAQAAAPELERVEFTARPAVGAEGWNLYIKRMGGCVVVPAGCATVAFGGVVYRIAWAETMPPKPAEVWIERSAEVAR